MARLRLTILGCGASPGVPRADGNWGACDPAEPRNRRSRCSALFERFGDGDQPTRLLVDTPPELRQQLIGAGITHLNAVAFTHSHADHLHGIDDLRAFWTSTRRLIDVFSDDATQVRLDAAFGYCFDGTATGSYPPVLRRHRLVPGVRFTVDGPGGPLDVLPFRQVHGEIDSIGLRVGAVAYSPDVIDLPPESEDALAGLDVWVVDALRETPHPSHFTVDQAIAWARRLRPRRTVLTHMHADLDYNVARSLCPPGIEPAHDGMTLESPLPA